MNIDDIEVEIIMGENTSTIVTEALLKLYRDNASKVLDSNLNETKKKN
ncbi:hypothetical protein LAV35_03815 [Clostridium sporogenes]|nr:MULTISPECIES: hypothetical protein [Clostridium]MCW6059735.1 hypothetical protein [Clostridium sporogenes]MCW6067312.1 hypothetical protein [Clostridium sporogenes]